MAEPPSAEVPARDPARGHVWYVYGVQQTDSSVPEVTGVGGRDVVGVDVGGVRALASAVPVEEFGVDAVRARADDVMWVGTQAAAHEGVLVAAMRSGPVIPLRFGAVYRERDGLEALVALHADALGEELDRLRGYAEWGVKLLVDPEAWSEAAADAAPAAEQDAKSEGHAFFARKRREQARREAGERAASRVADEVHRRLERLAADAQTSPPQRRELSGRPGDMILNGSYLVADRDREEFLTTAEQLRQTYGPLGATLDVSGPWPAHTFVRLPPLAGPPVAPARS